MALHYDSRDEAQFSPIYLLLKFDSNKTEWQSSSLLGLSRRGEISVRFAIYGVITGSLAVFGIVGNLLSILVLTRKSMRSPISCLLCGLAVTDLTACCLVIPYLCVPNTWSFVNEFDGWEGSLASLPVTWFLPWFHGMGMTCIASSVYFSVAVTIERYIAVCHPFRANAIFNCRRARFVGLAIGAFAILYDLPRWWELELKEIHDPVSQTVVGYRPVPSSLRMNQVYDFYYHDVSFILLIVCIPLVTMCVLNAKIYITVIRANRERQTLSKTQIQETSIARMLFIIVSLTIAAYTMTIVEVLGKKFISACNGPCLELLLLRDFFAMLNCSLNFFVYCIKSSKFQATLIAMWPLGLKGNLLQLKSLLCQSSYTAKGETIASDSSPKVPSTLSMESKGASNQIIALKSPVCHVGIV